MSVITRGYFCQVWSDDLGNQNLQFVFHTSTGETSLWRFQTLPSRPFLSDVAERNPLKLKFFLFPISVCVSKPIIYYQCGRGVFHGFPTHKSQLSLDVHQASKALTCFLSQLPRWRCLLWCPCHRPPQPQRHSGRSTPTPPALRCGAWENDGQP